MTTRKEIYSVLSSVQSQSQFSLYEKLCDCLVLDKEYPNHDYDRLHEWFDGCIKTIFYQPNELVLGLIGTQGIGKTHFFSNLLPVHEWYTDRRALYSAVPDIYHHFLSDFTDFDTPVIKKYSCTDGFYLDDTGAYKRMASIVFTSNITPEDATGRRRTLLINLKEIDWNRFNSINKLHLWAEIFQNFMFRNSGKHPFTSEYINKYLV